VTRERLIAAYDAARDDIIATEETEEEECA
jgi:hypothetical protein